jgi:aspartate racemase/PhzF family phenazine biosynthesis protein
MRAPLYQVDAFTAQNFSGNPAAVLVLAAFPPAVDMQAIAAENNLAETAFIVPSGGNFRIRWFTPTVEVPLCGHATLASAAVVMERLHPDRDHVVFESASGPLQVTRVENGFLMDLPVRQCVPIAEPEGLADALGAHLLETVWDGYNYLVRLDRAEEVRRLEPRLDVIAQMPSAGVIVTAAGEDGYDCVSRYFAPAKGIPEDPVTGGAHCALTPYWVDRLGKTELRAYQASGRGGEMLCRLTADRVELTGACTFFLEGEAYWEPTVPGSCDAGLFGRSRRRIADQNSSSSPSLNMLGPPDAQDRGASGHTRPDALKKIGLLGGMSWESSALYYQLINQGVRDRAGGFHSAPCLMSSVDFAVVEDLQTRGEWYEAGRLLAHEAAALERAGAECVVLCTNTMHKVADEIVAAISVPMLNVIDVTADAICSAGLSTVALLGTRFTMEERFYRDRMASHGLSVIVPTAAERTVIHDVIYNELVRGVVRDESRAAYREIIESVVDRGAEGVILGCTEIELLVGDEDCPVPAFPTTRLHADAAVEFAFS